MQEVPRKEDSLESERPAEETATPPPESASDPWQATQREEQPDEIPPGTLLPQGTIPTTPPPKRWLGTTTPTPPDSDTFGAPSAASRYGTVGGDSRFGGFEAIATAPPMERHDRRSFARGLREVAETIILAVLIFLLVRAVVQNFQVDGSSMEPTFENGWYLLVNKAIYWEINLETVHKFVPFVEPGDDPTRYVFRAPRRGDVVVFKAPRQERDFIKRIVGEPGEVVQISRGVVYVNGEPLDEPYVASPATSDFSPITVPADCVFVLGDNRNNSSDSRAWGAVPMDNIVGQASLTYWPFSSFGRVSQSVGVASDVGGQVPDKEPDRPVLTGAALAEAPLATCNP